MQKVIAWFARNPLLIKEMRRSKPVVSSMLTYSFGISWIIAAVSAIVLFQIQASGHITLILALYAIVVVSIPPFVAYSAAIFTVNEMQSEPFDLLHMTTISNAALIEGYILSTLYRCRGFFSVVLGFAPFALIGYVFLSVYEPYIRCLNYGILENTCEPPLFLPTAPLAFMTFVVIGSVSMLSGRVHYRYLLGFS